MSSPQYQAQESGRQEAHIRVDGAKARKRRHRLYNEIAASRQRTGRSKLHTLAPDSAAQRRLPTRADPMASVVKGVRGSGKARTEIRAKDTAAQ